MHGYFFGLFEAMSAIEIMDPKMDAGMMCNRESKAIKVNLLILCFKMDNHLGNINLLNNIYLNDAH